MRILMVHNRYKIRGGEDEVCDAERRLLESHGHEVDLYEDHNDRLTTLHPIESAANTIWSSHTYREIQTCLQQKPYDIVQVHNFLPLISPSVYYAAKKQNVPIVQTLHNYRLLCPNALFFRQGQVCESCLGSVFSLPGIYHGCYRDSRAATVAVAAMNSLHKGLKTWTSTVNAYIALTKFAKQKYIEGGIPSEKIWVKPNFVENDPSIGTGKGNYAIYVGRLSVEKGIDILLEAWQTVGRQLPLKIIGDGPLSHMVIEATQQNPSIEWLGYRPMPEVYDLMGEATVLIFPSKWYETFGRVTVEAFAKGTPVIAADIGAIAELVDHNRTGLLFEPSNAQSLVEQVKSLLAQQPTKISQMRQEARQEYSKKYTATTNYQQMLNIYHKAAASVR